METRRVVNIYALGYLRLKGLKALRVEIVDGRCQYYFEREMADKHLAFFKTGLDRVDPSAYADAMAWVKEQSRAEVKRNDERA